MSVMVPVWVPAMRIAAPGTGCPVPSRTLPLTETLSWAVTLAGLSFASALLASAPKEGTDNNAASRMKAILRLPIVN